MSSDAVIMFALTLTSLTLCVSLVVGWATLGRPRHALLWAGAFGAGAAQWALMGRRALEGTEPAFGTVATSTLGFVFTILLLAGFRARANNPLPARVVLAILIASSASVGLLSIGGYADFAKAVPHLMRALLLPFAAITIFGSSKRRWHTDVFASSVLLVFSALSLAIGSLRLFGTSESGELAHLLGMVGLPVAFANVGAATLLLLASDLAAKLEYLATTDPLTGLLNRRGLESAVDALGSSKRGRAILVLDVDGFKAVNDSRGHAAGDEVLVALAACLSKAVRSGDIAARLGGDEFALVLADAGLAEGESMAGRIRHLLASHSGNESNHPLPTVSIGVAGFGFRTPLGRALGDADRALYVAKTRENARLEANVGRQARIKSRTPVPATSLARRSARVSWGRSR